MKSTVKFKIIFLSALVSFPALGMEEEKPKGSLFMAIGHYERGEYEQAAKIFKPYVGKPVPIAEPFCLDLFKQGYLDPFQPIPRHEDSGEDIKARLYFEAAQTFPTLKNKPAKFINNLTKNDNNGPLLYLLGTLYETGTPKIKVDLKKAKDCYLKALKEPDFRAIFGLKRINSDADFKKERLEGISFGIIHAALDNMSKFNQNEGQIFASLQALSSNESKAILYSAALFGDTGAQFEWGKNHCSNEAQRLYWMTHCAASNHCGALSLCGHMLETGNGTPINYEKAYGYLKEAAHHPNAKGMEFSNFGIMHAEGKGTPQDYQLAAYWYEKAYVFEPENTFYIKEYGRALSGAGQYEKALPLLSQTQHLSDDSSFNYAITLCKLGNSSDIIEVVDIWSKLAAKGRINAIIQLVQLYHENKTDLSQDLLRTYKESLKKALLERETKDLTDVYLSLRNLYNHNKWLFENEEESALDYSTKALMLNPQNPIVLEMHAYDLKENGRLQEALTLFLELQKSGYPVKPNALGACYDLLSKEIQTSNSFESCQLAEKALAYYREQIKEEGNSPLNATAAFNMHALSVQHRIEPLSTDEHTYVLKMAADEGDMEAKNDLGIAYSYGLWGFEQDDEMAEKLLRQALPFTPYHSKLNLMSLLLRRGFKDEGQTLFNELWEENPEKFMPYIKNLISSFKKILKTLAEDNMEENNAAFLLLQKLQESEKFEENSSTNMILERGSSEKSDNDSLIIQTTQSNEKFEEDYTENNFSIIPVIQKNKKEKFFKPLQIETKGLEEHIIHHSKKEREEEEEKERLQRKLERLMLRIEDLRGKKQEKYRKIKTLMGQHMQTYGGEEKNGGGSGRRINIGGIHSGYHKPHKADIKAGALGSLTDVMEKSAKK